MRGMALMVAAAGAAMAGAVLLRPPARVQSVSLALPAGPGPAEIGDIDARAALVQAREQASRARERAAQLDRQARAATLASERATLALAALAARVQQAEAALASAEARAALVAGERRALDHRLARERAPVQRLLAGLQALVRRPPLLSLLQPGSLEKTVHLRAVIAAIGPQIQLRTAALRGQLARVRALEAEAVRMAEERRALQAGLVRRRTELAALSAAERIKARRAAGSADREAERAYAIAAEARDLGTLVGRIEAAGTLRARLAARPGPVSTPAGPSRPTAPSPRPQLTSARGAAPAPYRLPVAGRLAAETRPRGDRITLLPQPGAQVVAPAAGRVAFAGPYRGYGAIVILEHTDGWTSLVTGLGEVQVAVGQSLLAGSPLGRAPARAPAIALELRRDGRRVDPLEYLR